MQRESAGYRRRCHGEFGGVVDKSKSTKRTVAFQRARFSFVSQALHPAVVGIPGRLAFFCLPGLSGRWLAAAGEGYVRRLDLGASALARGSRARRASSA